tara:strand:+ start:1978 stop:2562 length:585 start_codon:yes stop_codon:yes gene_type:complete
MPKKKPTIKKKKTAKKTKVTKQPESNELVIPCSLYRSVEFESMIPDYCTDDVRCGRYHGSVFHSVKNFGARKWIVAVRILVDYEKYRGEGHEDEEIIAGCIRHLNQPPSRKKFQRRIRKPLYGTLEREAIQFEMKTHKDRSCITAILVTNERRNKNFFGEGLTGGIAGIGAKVPKLGRPKKIKEAEVEAGKDDE